MVIQPSAASLVYSLDRYAPQYEVLLLAVDMARHHHTYQLHEARSSRESSPVAKQQKQSFTQNSDDETLVVPAPVEANADALSRDGTPAPLIRQAVGFSWQPSVLPIATVNTYQAVLPSNTSACETLRARPSQIDVEAAAVARIHALNQHLQPPHKPLIHRREPQCQPSRASFQPSQALIRLHDTCAKPHKPLIHPREPSLSLTTGADALHYQLCLLARVRE
ncbi:hypothetical protein DEU56DRAFT_751772 [Suillus clintonianus]|uniref:uncharacterized protein n=1 Tax=Suillus clintonianus TaxID=1904413 RepID=UPI001B86409C|nr:uncharacterized protein DEU56DRAFT_751772 [Suillus clintonianus]KAG2153156.1 hypothetical protein DEU56DRAFT_751772 [Suillus clintonianus]